MEETVRERVEMLWSELPTKVAPYPEGVVAVPEPIQGTAFFPGGFGLWEPNERPKRNIQIMVVGHDFDTWDNYQSSWKRGSEADTNKTWSNLRFLFAQAGLDLYSCFFTNFYMGLREKGPNTGPFPGARDFAFVDRCVEYFQLQLKVVKPKLVITLGVPAMTRVGRLVFQLKVPIALRECKHVYHLREGLLSPKCFVALTHPSQRQRNIHRREYGKLSGSEAEIAMLRDALAHARG